MCFMFTSVYYIVFLLVVVYDCDMVVPFWLEVSLAKEVKEDQLNRRDAILGYNCNQSRVK